MQQNPFEPVSKLPDALQLNVCEKTIRRALKSRTNLKYRKAAKKTDLKNPHKAARLEFCENYEGINGNQWKNTVFIDEKVFSTDKDGRCGVWRPDRTRYLPQYVLPKTHSGRHTKPYWAWVTGHGPGEIIEVARRMNSAQYLRILNEILLPSIEGMFPNEAVIYIVEDISAVHTARIIQQWYREHPRLQRLIWPARSPDLNVIENVWAEMVREWHPRMARTEDELHERVMEAWRDLFNRPEYFDSLTASMPRKIQEIIEAGGGFINY